MQCIRLTKLCHRHANHSTTESNWYFVCPSKIFTLCRQLQKQSNTSLWLDSVFATLANLPLGLNSSALSQLDSLRLRHSSYTTSTAHKLVGRRASEAKIPAPELPALAKRSGTGIIYILAVPPCLNSQRIPLIQYGSQRTIPASSANGGSLRRRLPFKKIGSHLLGPFIQTHHCRAYTLPDSLKAVILITLPIHRLYFIDWIWV